MPWTPGRRTNFDEMIEVLGPDLGPRVAAILSERMPGKGIWIRRRVDSTLKKYLHNREKLDKLSIKLMAKVLGISYGYAFMLRHSPKTSAASENTFTGT